MVLVVEAVVDAFYNDKILNKRKKLDVIGLKCG
jgi:hypothetical protein